LYTAYRTTCAGRSLRTSLIREGFRKLEYLDAGNRIDKQISIKNDVPFFSDASRIGPVLTNVLSNAIIFSHKERQSFVKIEITVSNVEAIISITDNGIGIRPDILPKVYTMFYRGVEESQGAGLGLYIVKEIVSKLKGKVTIDSKEGECTTVTFVFPNEQMHVA
jgi:signal transduction histidine kinase